ncbi:hypothetical protein GCM10027423_17250 [Spirosoma arcticum]
MLLFLALSVAAVKAQVTTHTGGVRTERRINENTPLFDKKTGQRVSFQEYQQRMKNDPYAYYLEPVYDEYGKPTSYMIRPTTADEKVTHRFYDRDPAKQPKVGQPIAPFIMTGLDGKTYRSTDLLGNVVVLSFWISLEKPFWGDKQAVDFGNVVRPYQSETSPVVLGVLNSGQPQVADHLNTKTLLFMPVPDAYGFHDKYQVSTIPSFVIIDKAGKVAGFIEGPDYEKLKQILSSVMR